MNVIDIENPRFLKQLNIDELEDLCTDIRKFLIENVSSTGGHFSSNLGIVELTVALHYVFNAPQDKILFDVGHQSYVHKILTGRAKDFHTLRQYQGLSGFQKRIESEYDCFEAGHSSTSISGATGFALSRDLHYQNHHVIAVIGDAAMMSGESLEALNYLGSLNTKVIIILNDNNMSINENVGGISNALSKIRVSEQYHSAKVSYTQFMKNKKVTNEIYNITKKIKDSLKYKVIDDSLFKEFGLDYLGPVDGHNIQELINTLTAAKTLRQSVVVHIKTQKGKGYPLAENDVNGLYHAVPPFNYEEGIKKVHKTHSQSWSEAIANHIEYLMHKHKDIVVITPAMKTGSCLTSIFKHYPNRSYDVGIMEEHAMTLTAGLSLAGEFPFLSMYSSFFQRAYDQLNHDIARMDCPCIIGIDRADFVGGDGATHHGVFDLSLTLPIPNLIITAPSNQQEAEMIINTAYKNHNHPYMIRYSKNIIKKTTNHTDETIKIGQWLKRIYDENNKVTLISYGDHLDMLENLVNVNNLPINVVNAIFLKPMDDELLNKIKNTKICVYENVQTIGSLGQMISLYYTQNHIKTDITLLSIDDHYVTHGDNESLRRQEHLDKESVLQTLLELLKE